ncbi:MAG: hypothetical protein EBZ50_01585 [Alphaproteobacteria bacterium]|nr:hypothetical protein [Alphaproteobacteria bacterium]
MKRLIVVAAVALAGCIATYEGAVSRPIVETRVIKAPFEKVDACFGSTPEFGNKPVFGGPQRPARTVSPQSGAAIYSIYLPGWVGMRSNVLQQAFLYKQDDATRVDVSGLHNYPLPKWLWDKIETCAAS